MLDSIQSAIDEIAQGKMIIVVDDENRENEGDLVMAAEFATTETINFMASLGKGLICAPLTEAIAKKLDLPLMVMRNTDSMGTAFTVSVDATKGTTTGISTSERARTLQMLANPTSIPMDFNRPGHIFPLIAKEGGVLTREGHTEASVDLCKLAGLNPVGVICEVLNENGTCMRLPDLQVFAKKHDLKIISIEELIKYQTDNLIIHAGEIMSKILEGKLTLTNERVAIVTGRFNELITSKLHGGAIDCLKRHGLDKANITEAWVPGAFELPLVCQKLAATKKFDAIIALGCVIRGATPHFDFVCSEAAKGVSKVSMDHGIPVMFGVLTTDTIEQAIERAGTKAGNKGWEAAAGCVEMINLAAPSLISSRCHAPNGFAGAKAIIPEL